MKTALITTNILNLLIFIQTKNLFSVVVIIGSMYVVFHNIRKQVIEQYNGNLKEYLFEPIKSFIKFFKWK